MNMTVDWRKSSAILGILGSLAVLLAGALGALDTFNLARAGSASYTTSAPMGVALLVMIFAFVGLVGGLGKLISRRHAVWLLAIAGIVTLVLRGESVPAWSAAGAVAMIFAAMIADPQ